MPPGDVRFPALPGVATPAPSVVHRTWRYDFGPQWNAGIESLQPPTLGAAYPVLVPQCDADGNDLGGVRLPEIAVPLATYVGWNLRVPEAGFGEYLADYFGSFFPFVRSASARTTSGDPRPSIEERYASRDAYLSRYDAAAHDLAVGGYLRANDIPAMHARAAELWTFLHP